MGNRHIRYTRQRNRIPAVMTGALAIVFLAVAAAAILLFISVVRGMISDSGIVPGLSGSSGEESPYVDRKPGQVLPTWTGTERVNLLILGIDEREQESGPSRTDTLMLLTLNPTTLEAGVLSIPRDLWVPIPGHDQGRINTAHFLGEVYNHPEGGPGLAVETVELNLGVPIQYYARINFQGFIDLVDLIGGIDIYVEETINDPLYPDNNYGYDPLYIEAGQHHFNGELALKYARTRHNTNDFDRARRQQQVLLAILDRVTSLNLLPQLATRIGDVFAIVEDSVTTNMTLDEMLALGSLAIQVDRNTIRFGVLDNTCTEPYVTPEGAQVLVPIRDRMREMRDYIFGAAEIPGQTVAEEEATLAIFNGTARPGLAASTAQYLQENGLQVTAIDNADRADYAATSIILNRAKPVTAAQLLTLLNLPQSALVNGSNPAAEQDIVIILGADFAGPPATPTP